MGENSKDREGRGVCPGLGLGLGLLLMALAAPAVTANEVTPLVASPVKTRRPAWSCYSRPDGQGVQFYAQVWPNLAQRSLSAYRLRVLARKLDRESDVQELARISWIRSGIQGDYLVYQGESQDAAAELLIQARMATSAELLAETPGFLKFTGVQPVPGDERAPLESAATLHCLQFEIN